MSYETFFHARYLLFVTPGYIDRFPLLLLVPFSLHLPYFSVEKRDIFKGSKIFQIFWIFHDFFCQNYFYRWSIADSNAKYPPVCYGKLQRYFCVAIRGYSAIKSLE